VFCYNVQPYIEINYADGTSWVSEQSETQPEFETQGKTTYILNTNTKKFHYPDCSSVNDMKEKNKQVFMGSRDDAIELGYTPCRKCRP
jgi:DNA-entry nuclease